MAVLSISFILFFSSINAAASQCVVCFCPKLFNKKTNLPDENVFSTVFPLAHTLIEPFFIVITVTQWPDADCFITAHQ